jgi:hypothetical protein
LAALTFTLYKMHKFMSQPHDRFPLQSTRHRVAIARPIVEAPLDRRAAASLESYDLPRGTRPTPVPMRGAVAPRFQGVRITCCPVRP